MSARVSARFSIREIVGCEHSAAPVSGSRSRARLNAGSARRSSASLPSSYPAAIIMIRTRMMSSRLCRTLPGARGSGRHFATRPARSVRRSTSRRSDKPASELISAPSKLRRTGLPFKGDQAGATEVDCVMVRGPGLEIGNLGRYNQKIPAFKTLRHPHRTLMNYSG